MSFYTAFKFPFNIGTYYGKKKKYIQCENPPTIRFRYNRYYLIDMNTQIYPPEISVICSGKMSRRRPLILR